MTAAQIPHVRSYRVGVCVPVREQAATGWCYDFGRMMAFTAAQRPDIELRQYFAPVDVMPQNREMLVGVALRDRCTHVLFLEPNTRFPRDLLIRLLAHDLPLVAVNYTSATPPFMPSAWVVQDDTLVPFLSEADDGLEEVAVAGFGSMLVEARVLEAMKPPRFHYMWSPSSASYLGDEVYFCEQAKTHNVKIVIDHSLSHECSRIGFCEQTTQNAVLWAKAQEK